MQPKSRHALALSAALFTGLFFLGIDASAQDTKKPATKATSACKGLDEKACKGKAADCLWIQPKKGTQRPYCRMKAVSKKKT